ncbi:MAG: carotenoid oxygenase family protein [Caulobacterales bacterium]|nr:carotenoid oxygenase family protein [Caulobacterales bacterium]
MIPSRRAFLMGAAALSAAVVTPDLVRAAQAAAAAPDWALATADVETDIAPRALSLVHGRAPDGLEGVLFRNGPAKFRRPGGSAQHWFDGDGMVRRFALSDGQAQLSARFVATRKRAQEDRLGAMVMPGFGTLGDPRAEIGSPDDGNAANTSVILAGDQLWALWEAGSPVAMDPVTLETRNYVTLRPDLRTMPFLAHPRIEPDGRIWNLGMGGDQAFVWRLAADGTLEDASLISLPRASYVHDFTATERHLIIVLQPWVRERQTMPFADGFAWRPETGTQILVLDKDDLTRRRIFETEAFGFFHLGDAWIEGGDILFDLALHRDMDFAAHGASEVVNGVPLSAEAARLGLIRLKADGSTELTRLPVIAEFPRSDPRRAGLARRLSIHTTAETPEMPFARAIGVTDWSDGSTRTFDFGPNHVVDEMVFAPKPGSTSEADGWLIGPSLNLAERRTELQVLDIARIEDGPVATWAADVALPVAFHGIWTG